MPSVFVRTTLLFLRRTKPDGPYVLLCSCLCDDIYIYTPAGCRCSGEEFFKEFIALSRISGKQGREPEATTTTKNRPVIPPDLVEYDEVSIYLGETLAGAMKRRVTSSRKELKGAFDRHVYRCIFCCRWLDMSVQDDDARTSVFQALLDDEFNGTSHLFRDRYLEFLSSVIKDYATVSVAETSPFETIQFHLRTSLFRDDWVEMDNEGQILAAAVYGSDQPSPWKISSNDSTLVSASLGDLVVEIRKTQQYKLFREFSWYRRLSGEKETELMRRLTELEKAGLDLPKEWQRVIHMRWPHCAPNDFNVDLKIESVDIC
jgi:hypothetical protein